MADCSVDCAKRHNIPFWAKELNKSERTIYRWLNPRKKGKPRLESVSIGGTVQITHKQMETFLEACSFYRPRRVARKMSGNVSSRQVMSR
jgi:hypothetical protein